MIAAPPALASHEAYRALIGPSWENVVAIAGLGIVVTWTVWRRGRRKQHK